MWDKNLLKKDFKRFGGGIILLLIFIYTCHFCKVSLCPLKAFLGLPCPLCGVTRASILLLQLKIREAFTMNPSIFLILLWLFYCFYYRYIRKTKNNKYLIFVTFSILGLIVLIYFVKMAWYFPIQEPYVYNYKNLLFFIKLKFL